MTTIPKMVSTSRGVQPGGYQLQNQLWIWCGLFFGRAAAGVADSVDLRSRVFGDWPGLIPSTLITGGFVNFINFDPVGAGVRSSTDPGFPFIDAVKEPAPSAPKGAVQAKQMKSYIESEKGGFRGGAEARRASADPHTLRSAKPALRGGRLRSSRQPRPTVLHSRTGRLDDRFRFGSDDGPS